MAQVVKNIQIGWTWTTGAYPLGDASSIRKFNVVLAPDGADPNSAGDNIASAQVNGDQRGHVFQNVVMNAGTGYNAWVQAVYTGKDSAWVNSGGFTAVDDGSATISGVRTFTAQPVPPYNIGDVWLDVAAIKRCTTAKSNVQSYSEFDWEDQASSDAANLIHSSLDWVIGTNGSQGNFIQNGIDSENEIVADIGPHVIVEELWNIRDTDTNSDADGGWINDFEINPEKAYIWGCYIKTFTDAGISYLGCKPVETLAGADVSNPYFWTGDLPENDQWYLVLGIVHPAGFTGTDVGISGVYEMTTGSKVADGTEYRFKAGVTAQRHRCYHYYNTGGTGNSVQQMARPFVIESSKVPSVGALTSKIDGVESGADRVDTILNNPVDGFQMRYGKWDEAQGKYTNMSIQLGVTGQPGEYGVIGSENFVKGGTGWAIDGAGNAEFNNVTVRGTIEASRMISKGLPLWNTNLIYNPGDTVYYNSIVYECTQTTTLATGTPYSATAYWDNIGAHDPDSFLNVDGIAKEIVIGADATEYVRLSTSDLEFFYGGEAYSSVKRILMGSQTSNVAVTFNPPFKTAPTVLLACKDLRTHVAGWGTSTSNFIQLSTSAAPTVNGFTPRNYNRRSSGSPSTSLDTTGTIAWIAVEGGGGAACPCDCNYACTCNCNYACTCNCNYCTCQCNYCTCDCNYACTCDCAYSDINLKSNVVYI